MSHLPPDEETHVHNHRLPLYTEERQGSLCLVGWGGDAGPVQRLQAARGRLQFNIKKVLSTPKAVWKRNSQKVGAPYSQL